MLSKVFRRHSSNYALRQVGVLHTRLFERFFEANEKAISPLHDIPLEAHKPGVYNMIVEVPRWTNAKIEISRSKDFNPLVQDRKKEQLRYVPNIFPFTGYIHNYGALPQTWEDPSHIDRVTGQAGDNDPLDVCEIGQSIAYTGQVKQVKILGCMPLIDEGETDWKIFAIDINDPMADKVNTVTDIEKYFPGLLSATSNWFRDYKIPDGKPANEIGSIMNRDEALSIIESCHQSWQSLVNSPNLAESHDISILNGTLEDTPGYTTFSAPGKPWADHDKRAEPEKWHFV